MPAGLHPIVPALVELVSEQVKACCKQLPQLHLLIEVSSHAMSCV